jgi:hypothetical protein
MSTTTAPNLTAEDMQTLLIAARLGYAWSVEETQSHAMEVCGRRGRVGYLQDRTERIREVIARLEEHLGTAESKRMIQKTVHTHPTRHSTPEDRYCAPQSRSSRWQP